MSRPRSEPEYLAHLIPPSVAAAGLSRRGFLKGTLAWILELGPFSKNVWSDLVAGRRKRW